MARSLILALVALIILTLPSSANTDVTVTVTGNGPTRTAALEDATRQAVQLAMKQLVVSDRRIVNDEIIRDETISTLNGFIRKRTILNTRRSAGEIEIDVRITVSAEDVSNYIGDYSARGNAGGVSIDGGSLGAELQRQREAPRALGHILERYLRGFPRNAIDLRVKSARISQQDSGLLEIALTAQISPDLVRALRSSVKPLAINKVRIARKFPGSSWFTWQSGIWGAAPIDLSMGTSGAAAVQWGQKDHFTVCFGEEEVADCYILPGRADYLFDRPPSSQIYELVIGFKGVSRDGRTIFCLPSNGFEDWKTARIPFSELTGYEFPNGPLLGLSIGLDSVSLMSTINIAGQSVDELDKLIPIAAYYDPEREGYIHDFSTERIEPLCGS